MEIPIDVQSWFEPATSLAQNSTALRALLDCLITLNESYLRDHAVPELYKSGVRYGRTTVWDPIPALYSRRYGDCKSLSAALIAQYRQRGIECAPCFRWLPRKGSSRRVLDFHILVQIFENGKTRFEDPSKVLGMGANEFSPINSTFHQSWRQKLGF